MISKRWAIMTCSTAAMAVVWMWAASSLGQDPATEPPRAEPAAQQPSQHRLGHAGRQRPGDCGIDSTAPGAEDILAGGGGDSMSGGDGEIGHQYCLGWNSVTG